MCGRQGRKSAPQLLFMSSDFSASSPLFPEGSGQCLMERGNLETVQCKSGMLCHIIILILKVSGGVLSILGELGI